MRRDHEIVGLPYESMHFTRGLVASWQIKSACTTVASFASLVLDVTVKRVSTGKPLFFHTFQKHATRGLRNSRILPRSFNQGTLAPSPLGKF